MNREEFFKRIVVAFGFYSAIIAIISLTWLIWDFNTIALKLLATSFMFYFICGFINLMLKGKL